MSSLPCSLLHLSRRAFSPSAVAKAIHKAATAIHVNPSSRPKEIPTKRLKDRLAKRKRTIFVVPCTYLPPLLYTHHIPDYHIAPPLRYPNFPDPMRCAKGTPVEGLVSEEDQHVTFPNEKPDKFAVFAPDHHESRQFKVMVGDRIMVSLYYNKETGWPYRVDEQVIFDNVLCVASRDHTLIGRPLLPGPRVLAVVDEITQTAKKIWIWKRKHNRKKRIIGSREWVSIIRITDIECNFEDFTPLLLTETENANANGNTHHERANANARTNALPES